MSTTPTTLGCPACLSEFDSQLVIHFDVESQDSDFCPRYVGDNPMPNMLHVCPDCGFTGFQADFSPLEDEELQERLKQATAGFDWQPNTELDGAERYRRAAVFAVYLGKSNAEIAELYLQATWCARLSGEGEDAEQRSRRKAADYFERALNEREFGNDDQAVAHYLIGELYRRLGKRDDALKHFDAVSDFPDADPMIVELRDEQRDSMRLPEVEE